MDFKQLKTFLKICETNGFTSAASDLGYAQSTVTTQIKLLEDELNVLLFERIGKSISLTEEGKKLLPYARQIIQTERDIYNNLAPSAEVTGHLIIGAAESLCNLLVPKIVKIYKEKYPNVNIEIKFGNSKLFPILLRNNEIDLALSIGQKIDDRDIISYSLQKERMSLLVTPTHPLARLKHTTLQQISNFPLLLTSANCAYRSSLINMANKLGVSLNIALETGNVHALKQFAISGLGIAFLPYVAVEDVLKKGKLVELDWYGDDFNIISEIIYHKDKHTFEAMKRFLELSNEIITSN